MTKNVQFQRLVRSLNLRADDSESSDSEEDEDIVRSSANTATYSSPTEVIFEGCRTVKSTEELVNIRGSLNYSKATPNQTLLSPNTTLQSLWRAIKNCTNTDVRYFCSQFGINKSKIIIHTNIEPFHI